jgi:hypothetical protein
MEAASVDEQGAGAVRIGVRKFEKLSAAFVGNDSSVEKEAEELIPGEVRRGAKFIGVVEGEAAADEGGSGRKGIEHSGWSLLGRKDSLKGGWRV